MAVSRLLAAAVFLALLVPTSATAQQAVTRGSPLTSPPNVPFGCEASVQQDFVSGLFVLTPMGHQSCTWWSSGDATNVTNPNTGFVPATGIVTNVRVLSGPNPAPLAIVQLRSATGCCNGVRESPVFQPTPNGVTQVTVNWPVEVVRDSIAGVSTNDIIGFSAVGGTGTLPLSDQGPATHSPQGAFTPGVHSGTMTAPKIDPGVLTLNYRAAIGYEPLLQYDFVPCPNRTNQPIGRRAKAAQVPGCPNTGPQAPSVPVVPGPNQAVPLTPVFDVRNGFAQLNANGRMTLRILCQQDVACIGRLRVFTRGPNRRRLFGAPVSIPARATENIGARLSRRLRRVLNRRARTPLSVEMLLVGAAQPVVENITFRR